VGAGVGAAVVSLTITDSDATIVPDALPVLI
jgi:hypothetical protein